MCEISVSKFSELMCYRRKTREFFIKRCRNDSLVKIRFTSGNFAALKCSYVLWFKIRRMGPRYLRDWTSSGPPKDKRTIWSGQRGGLWKNIDIERGISSPFVNVSCTCGLLWCDTAATHNQNNRNFPAQPKWNKRIYSGYWVTPPWKANKTGEGVLSSKYYTFVCLLRVGFGLPEM